MPDQRDLFRTRWGFILAGRIAVFDTIASLLAAFVILPAMAAGGVSCDSSGPGLIFIYLCNVMSTEELPDLGEKALYSLVNMCSA